MFVAPNKSDNIGVIIKVLNEPDLKVKRATLTLLKVMIKNCPDQLQASFLNTPEAIGAGTVARSSCESTLNRWMQSLCCQPPRE